ncbi:MAG: phenylacetate-CoA oxygenase subunit PaaI [Gammaproteobacteria bacterium]|nr:phenylacetate-CoA oxygenase subunit PaaI [Gammaproteobacteria bacterium]
MSSTESIYKPHQFDFDNWHGAPEEYKKMLCILVGKQLQGEIAACELFCRTVQYLEKPEHKVELVETAHDEAVHVAAVEKLAKQIGVDLELVLSRRRPLAMHFLGKDDEVKDWVEVCVFKHLIDRAGRIWLWTMRDSSFKPYSEVLAPILRDEARHGNEGANEIVEFSNNGKREEVQRYVNRWFPRAMRLLGRPRSQGNQIAHKYGLKTEDSDTEMRKYVKEITPALEKANIVLPTPDNVRGLGVDILDVTW